MKLKIKKIIFPVILFLSLFLITEKTQAADINASASRTSGVAPLAVHFNADLTASSPTERSFHDLDYSWNFGDPTSGNWGTSGKPKNSDKGPVAAHVYENPGTFNVTLTVRDQTGATIDSETFVITVDDPDVIFAGTKTTCISTGTDFTGCPSGANEITTNDLNVIVSYTDAGERVLLKRGDSWTVNSNISFSNNSGPISIGAFGNCVNPDELEICENAPHIIITGGENFLNLDYKNDWRLTDIYFSEVAKVSNIVGGVTGIKNNLFLRLKSIGFNSPLGWSNWRYDDFDYMENNAIISCRVADFSNNGFYVGSEKLALLGNIVQNSDTTHVVRVWQMYIGVIGHNTFSGSSLENSNGRHALKLHGPNETSIGTFLQTSNGGLRNKTQLSVIQNNTFGTSGPWPVSVGPADSGQLCNIQDIIIEKNKSIADYGELSPMSVQVGLMFEGRYITARNNILDGRGSANGYTGIYVARRGVEWTPLGNRVYNNTIYSRETSNNGITGVSVHADADDTIVRNNYISFPNATGPKTLLDDDSGNATASNNVLTDIPYFVDPDNANPILRNFRLTASSTQAIGQGFTVPLLDDFLGNPRDSFYDIGAFEYNSGDTTAPNSPSGLGVI